MSKMTLAQAAAFCGGHVEEKYANVEFFGAGNDTRVLEPGQLFVALQGDRDGHDFIPAALEKGAAAVLCTHADGDFPAIVVEDTRTALGRIAAGERMRLGCKVVGVTGSVGKSTTKELIYTVLSSVYNTGKTPANHNNDIGMPMGILALPEDTQVAVLEMGMNHFGEIAYLSRIARPDVAVIVNIGTMHIEHLGSREGILQAKLEILHGLRPDGKVFLNGDDDMLWKSRSNLPREASFFGAENRQCSLRSSNIVLESGGIRMSVTDGKESLDITVPLEGRHFVPDILAAVAVGLELGVPGEKIVQALAGFRTMAGRQEIYEKNGFTIIEDCYNAGPESMAAALDVLANQKGRKIAVLGDMLELGPRTQAEHYRIGRLAAERVDHVLAFGPNGPRVLKGCITGGMVDGRVRSYTDRDELVRELKRLARPGDVLLFKGSRGMRMELVLEQFLDDKR